MIQELELLSLSEVRLALEGVRSLEFFWVQRHLPLPYYTLGAASYLDAIEDSENYHRIAEVINPVLIHKFNWLYESVRRSIQEFLGEPVQYSERFARPGFHVLKAHAWFTLPFATIHADEHFKLLDWSGFKNPDFSRPFSFTLPLKLPFYGGGLDLWGIEFNEIRGYSRDERRTVLEQLPAEYLPYRAGCLVIVPGLPMHRMASFSNIQPDDERITLQGHGLWTGKEWVLYW